MMTDFGSLCTKPVIYSTTFVQTPSYIPFLFTPFQFQSNQHIISEDYYNQLRQYLYSLSLLVSCPVISHNNIEKSSDRKLNSTIRGFSVFCYFITFYVSLHLVFLCIKECFCFFYNYTAQCKQCDHIRNCHQSVEDIGNGPYSTYCHVRSDKYCQDVEPAVCKDCFLMSMCQIFQTSFTVVIPSKDCCKCEEYQTDH